MSLRLTAEQESKLNDLFKQWDNQDGPGAVVGVSAGGETVYEAAFGLSSVQLGTLNKVDTRLRIASVSKQFACMAALLLQERGTFDVEAPLKRYIDDLPEHTALVTPTQLMMHTGGLRCFLDLTLLSNGFSLIPTDAPLEYQRIQSQGNFAPGEQMNYNNGAYQLLCLAMERAVGAPFETILADLIFKPLGMANTLLHRNDLDLLPGLADLHLPLSSGGFRRGIFPSDSLADGGVVSTVGDMLQWGRQFNAASRTLGGAETWAKFMQRPTYQNGRIGTYGAGLIHWPLCGLEAIQHSGGVLGGTSQFVYVPSQDVCIAIMTNRSDANPIELSARIFEIVVPAHLSAPLVPALAEDYLPFVGKYFCTAKGLTAELLVSQEKLALSFNQGNALPLVRDGAGHCYRVDVPGTGDIAIDLAYAFEHDGLLMIEAGGSSEEYQKVSVDAPSVDVLSAAITGSYESPDLQAKANIYREDDKLLLRVQGRFGRNTFLLAPIFDNVIGMKTQEIPLPLTGTIVVDDQRAGFQMNTGRTRGLQFKRIALNSL